MKNNSFTLPSFAKINLFLRILGKRTDGFHELFTAFQTVSLHDNLTFENADELSLSSNDEKIPCDERNLIIKAVKKLAKKKDVKKGAKIHLEKNIPFPGGLGGGSSNAAVTLLGLAMLWDLEISRLELCEIGSEIGSDVPFFFYGGTAFGKGRGTEISPTQDFTAKHLLVITPNIEISTAQAYQQLNAQDLTKIDSKSILKICREDAERLESGHFSFINDFEKSVFEIEPKIKSLKEQLLDLNAKTVLLSGSGASVFAIFDNEEKRQIAFEIFENVPNIREFAVETVSQTSYRNYLKPCETMLPKSF